MALPSLRTGLLAAFVRSIDAQTTLLRRAMAATVAGRVLTVAIWPGSSPPR